MDRGARWDTVCGLPQSQTRCANIFSHEVRNVYLDYTDVKYQLMSTLPSQYKKRGKSLFKEKYAHIFKYTHKHTEFCI